MAEPVGSYHLRNPEVIDRYLRGVRLMLNKLHCAQMAGVTTRTVIDWFQKAALAEDEGREDEYTEFVRQVRQAEADRGTRLLIQADKMGFGFLDDDGKMTDKPNWAALKFLLNRAGYIEEQRLAVAGDERHPVILKFDDEDEKA
jgi:hypothetical protein